MTEGSFFNSQVSGKNRKLMDLYMPCYQGHNLIGFTGGEERVVAKEIIMKKMD